MLGSIACATPVVSQRSSSGNALAPPTAAGRDYAKIEAEVLVALNQARTRPSTAVGWLEQLAGYYSGNRVKRPWWPTALQTTEGVTAVREAIAAVQAQSPVAALTLNAELVRAARDHAADQAKTGDIGHTGSNGSSTQSRVSRYAIWQVSLAENIDYQPMVRGQDVIESLIVDDGVQGRGHRRNVFQSSARLVGIACGPHPKYEAMCVIVQAGAIEGR
jgi:hypothetical protein